MTTLLLEPFGGLAGDMLLAALLDLGDERFTLASLRELADALVPGECRLEARTVTRGGLRALHLQVATAETSRAPHRHLADLVGIVRAAGLEERVAERAVRCLGRVAGAEARAHGIAPEEVHFHEVGAVDTLVDVCGAFLAFERLGATAFRATPPLVGSGTVRCAHGEMPVPAPGTAELLRGMPWRPGGEGERLTPTGAAILAELAPDFGEGEAGAGAPAPFVARAVGYGAGSRDPREGPPNLARVQLGEAGETRAGSAARAGVAWLCEFNLDDATGEEIGFCLERLRAAGALEAWTHAVQMKKDRPGVVVSALCRADGRAPLETAAFASSPTLGVRWRRCERAECEREHVRVELDELGGRAVRAVVRRRPDGAPPGPLDVSAEYDDLAELARATGLPLRDLEQRVREAVIRRIA